MTDSMTNSGTTKKRGQRLSEGTSFAHNRKTTREKKALLGAYLLLALFLSPLFILGEDAHIRVHDNLDSNIAWYKVLKESGQLFGGIDAKIAQVQNGQLSRNAYGTEWSGIVWLHALFPSMVAYALSQTITRVFAFIGMYLLLKRHFVKEQEAWPITIGVALAFALTPFWPSGMLSTLGHPLALWAFLNIRAGDCSWKNWLTLILLPFYASIVLGFLFFLAAMAGLWLWDVLMKRRVNWTFLLAIGVMSATFLLVDYRLVASMLVDHEPTHRSEFISSRHPFWRSVKLTFKNYVLGHYHVMTVHTFVILPLSVAALVAIFLRKSPEVDKKLPFRFLFLFGFNFLLSAWYAFWFNTMWTPLKERFDLLVTFNWARFHFLRPLVIYLLFALSAWILWKQGRLSRRIVNIALVLQIAILSLGNEEIVLRLLNEPSFREFYAEKQFAEIRNDIGKEQSSYRVASIGLHPAIAQYNGFYTLDTYNNFYPLTYKYQFREIIEKELAKNKAIRIYYDEWGSRNYLFVAELGKHYDFRKDSRKTVKNLDLNTEAFKRMGGKYLFSSVEIENARENRLKLMKVYDHPESAWRVYVYEAL